jgi:hypothetical protein
MIDTILTVAAIGLAATATSLSVVTVAALRFVRKEREDERTAIEAERKRNAPPEEIDPFQAQVDVLSRQRSWWISVHNESGNPDEKREAIKCVIQLDKDIAEAQRAVVKNIAADE